MFAILKCQYHEVVWVEEMMNGVMAGVLFHC